MTDIPVPLMIVGAVTIVVAILYILDRRSKDQSINVADLFKLTAGAGGIAGAIVGSFVSGEIGDVSSLPVVQDMFVGKPEF